METTQNAWIDYKAAKIVCVVGEISGALLLLFVRCVAHQITQEVPE